MHNKVRVAIAGVGNCASALVQGTLYYDRLHHSGFHNDGTSGSNDRLHYNRNVEKGRQGTSDLKRGNEISNKVRVSRSGNADLAADALVTEDLIGEYAAVVEMLHQEERARESELRLEEAVA